MSYPILYDKAERVQTPSIADVGIADLTIIESEAESTSAFNTLGYGTLTDAIYCSVTEQRNGAYELVMQYPISGVHFADIRCRNIIVAKPNYTDDPQPFRIYRITKPLNGICTIYAQHLCYDMGGYEMPYGLTANNAGDACALLTDYATPFTITTPKTTVARFRTYEPASIRSWFGGKSGSLLDLYGGEWHWDWYTGTLESARGENRGVTIRYGKNLTALKQDEDYSQVYSGVVAYWMDDEGNIVQSDRVSTGIVMDDTRTLYVDASGDFDEMPTVANLTSRATAFIEENNLNTPRINLTLDFVQLDSLRGRVDLCDTVTVVYDELGVSATTKCIETTWDVLNERYSSTKFGEAITNIADTIAKLEKGSKK